MSYDLYVMTNKFMVSSDVHHFKLSCNVKTALLHSFNVYYGLGTSNS